MDSSLLIKYKPNSINDFNINSFTKKLINIYFENNKLKFLINGNSSTGKSSLINVLLNNYYNNDKKVINENIIYINLLKEQGINYYRNELRNFCQINNINKCYKKKTVIFDDIDLLNDQCQQIFNTLISNYDNINFIISCNDLHKIQGNIINKLEFIKIDIIDNKFLGDLLDKIIVNEKISINDECKNYIIKTANYSIPNLINNVDKLLLIYKDDDNILNINTTNIDQIISNILISEFHEYIELCKHANYQDSIFYIINLYDRGYSVIDILDEFLIYIKNYSDLKDEYKYKIIKLIYNYINIFNNINKDNIELLFLTNNIIKILK